MELVSGDALLQIATSQPRAKPWKGSDYDHLQAGFHKEHHASEDGV